LVELILLELQVKQVDLEGGCLIGQAHDYWVVRFVEPNSYLGFRGLQRRNAE
jgi:hypothetical protein